MPPEKPSGWVALVDDDVLMRSAVQGLLNEAGWPSRAFASAGEFLASGAWRTSSCLITDICMPGMSGLDLQARLKAEQIHVPIIFITAHGDEDVRLQALRSGGVAFLAKPVDHEALLEAVRAALQSRIP